MKSSSLPPLHNFNILSLYLTLYILSVAPPTLPAQPYYFHPLALNYFTSFYGGMLLSYSRGFKTYVCLCLEQRSTWLTASLNYRRRYRFHMGTKQPCSNTRGLIPRVLALVPEGLNLVYLNKRTSRVLVTGSIPGPEGWYSSVSHDRKE